MVLLVLLTAASCGKEPFTNGENVTPTGESVSIKLQSTSFGSFKTKSASGMTLRNVFGSEEDDFIIEEYGLTCKVPCETIQRFCLV